MSAVLVSGAAAHVSEVANALRAHGASVTEVVDRSTLPEVCAAAGAGAFDSYIQLPQNFQAQGETAIRRVHDFYAGGVLGRFLALAAALPSLTSDARVTFVLGQLPPEVGSVDDREARESLTRVLAHAAQADADGKLTVRLVSAGCGPDEIASIALGLGPSKHEVDRLADARYPEWRMEMLSLAFVQT